MLAWIKPSDLGGDKFLFGQTSQGIHNGIRNGGFLHQAHWGADTNGATNLNGYLADDEDRWVHAAWTYDAATDTGKIYLDGKLDWQVKSVLLREVVQLSLVDVTVEEPVTRPR